MISEAELQEQIVTKILDSSFFELIYNKDDYLKKIDDWNNEQYQPYFSVNYQIREKYINCVRMILEGLSDDLTIVNGEKIKNISLHNSERLYPDIILYNEENSKYFIVELKRSGEAERQAVTELLGYQLEIKNHLPFINNFDMPLIIVATEFNTLLLHSIASILLNNIPVMCLRPILKNDVFNGFDILDVQAWSCLEQSNIEFESMNGYSVCLYGKNEEIIKQEEVFADMELAIEYLKNDANKIGSHGFCIAYADYDADVIDSPISTSYTIAIFTINPYSIYYKSLLGNERSIIAKHINKCIRETDLKEHSNYSDKSLTRGMYDFLNSKYRPTMEGFINFDQYIENIAKRGIPVFCDAWGEVGEYIRKLYIHPYIRNSVIPRKEKGYKDPCVFLRLLSYMSRNYTFANGFEFCGEYLKFGYQIGNISNLCYAALEKRNDKQLNRIKYEFCKISNSFQEIGELFEKIELVPKIMINLENLEQVIKDLEYYIEWFYNILPISTVESEAFMIGTQYYAFFIDKNVLNTQFGIEMKKSFMENVYSFFECLLMECLNSNNEDIIKRDLFSLCHDIASKLNEYSWKTVEELIALIKKEDTIIQIRTLNDYDKHELVRLHLYEVLQTRKALIFPKVDVNIEDVIRKHIKDVDLSWMLLQLQDRTDGKIKYLVITNNNEVGIETCKFDNVLQQNIKIEEECILIKLKIGMCEVIMPIEIDKLIEWNKENRRV